jgi:serine/threonine protein kinase/formylglycine-generating enzyme required for sulfatase activity
MPETGPVLFGQYEVPRRPDGSLWELGHGGMGTTYLATDTKLKVEVVLKLINPQLLADERIQRLFLREARAAAKVRHPNVAAVVNLHDEPPFYYAMEYVQGKSLGDVLSARGGSLPVPMALDFADQVAAALGAMARERIVHRDLKPSNLMLVHDEERPFHLIVKVIDFGLAKGFNVEGEADVETHLSSSLSQSVFSGTPYYASPEQCATEPNIDTRSDLYSLGVILWQMITGKRPFLGQLGQVLSMHQAKEPPWEQMEGVPEPVVAILRKLLAKDRKDRYQSPRELRDAIARWLSGVDPTQEAPRRAYAGAMAVSEDAPTMVAAESIRLGSTLADRFRLGEEIATTDGSKLFKAADNVVDQSVVALKLLPDLRIIDGNVVKRIEQQIEAMRANPHPVMLSAVDELRRSGTGLFFTREWVEGFSLLELVKARGELRPPEVWRLLSDLPSALDHAAAHGLTLAEPLLRKIFVCPPPGAPADAAWLALREQPIETWPDFRLRWNAVSIPPQATTLVMSSTAPPTRSISASEDPAAALGVLVRVLLGGRQSLQGPLTAISPGANLALGRALAPGGGTAMFGSAQKLWNELLNPTEAPLAPAGAAAAGAGASASAEAGAKDKSEKSRKAEKKAEAKKEKGPSKPSNPNNWMGIPRWVLFVGGIILFSGIWSSNRSERKSSTTDRALELANKAKAIADKATKEAASQTTQANVDAKTATKSGSVPPVPAIPVPPKVPALATTTRAQPYANSLGMEFVPVPGIDGLLGVWKVRVSDFKTYCEATGFEQTGGVRTRRVEKDDKGEYRMTWKLDPNASWKAPGFSQGPDHPVLGVSWQEATAFCKWLTEKERKEGRLLAGQSYRLPTESDWNAAAGETKYPWGNDFVLPQSAGNFFDASAAAEIPGKWSPVPGNDGYPFTSPGGGFDANKFGIFDLGGNAREFCEDDYDADDDAEKAKPEVAAQKRAKEDEEMELHVVRGSSWNDRLPEQLALSHRVGLDAKQRDDLTSFRVVLATDGN